jgi:hypothetical protein
MSSADTSTISSEEKLKKEEVAANLEEFKALRAEISQRSNAQLSIIQYNLGSWPILMIMQRAGSAG